MTTPNEDQDRPQGGQTDRPVEDQSLPASAGELEPLRAGPGGPPMRAAPEELARLRRKADEHERLLRALADAENRRKRIERDAELRIRYATQGMLTDLLPVFDDLVRAKEAAAQVAGGEALIEGVRLVETHLLEALDRHGVRPIRTVGERFDPQRHEAVSVVYSDEHPESTVVEEVQRGWRFEDRVIRAAKVVVNVGRPGGTPNNDATQH